MAKNRKGQNISKARKRIIAKNTPGNKRHKGRAIRKSTAFAKVRTTRGKRRKRG